MAEKQIKLGVLGAIVFVVAAVFLLAFHSGNSVNGDVKKMGDVKKISASSKKPLRVLSLCSTATDTIVRMGITQRLVAMDDYGSIIPGTQGIATVGKDAALSREKMMELKLDLALIWWYQDQAANLFEELGVPVVKFHAVRAAQIPQTIRTVGQVMDEPARAEPIALKVEQYFLSHKLESENAQNQPTVYLELYSPLKTCGSETYLYDVIQLAGARNIAADSRGNLLLSVERLMQTDPQMIFFLREFANENEMRKRPGFAALSAVRSDRITAIPRYWTIAGASLPEAVEGLRRSISQLNLREPAASDNP